MNKQSKILHTCVSIFALILLLSGSLPAQTSTSLPTTAPTKPPSATAANTTSTAVGSSKNTCLGCHGPYEKIIAATVDYKMLSGDQEIMSNPHRYVPHNSKDAKNIPECSNCHKPHPVPLTSKEGMPKPNTKLCYGCHHAKVLQCGTCH